MPTERSRVKQKKETPTQKKKRLEKLYDKKPLVEFVVAVLSIPSIILLLMLNYNSLKNLNNAKVTPTPVPNAGAAGSNLNLPNFFSKPVTRTIEPTEADTSSQGPCNKSLGPISIAAPNEGAVISNNPVEVDISYDDSTYCEAVWSYSVNGSGWSDYNNNNVALYNLPNGPVKFQLRVKSTTSTDQTTLTRNFTYNGQSTAPTNASGSAQ